MQAQRGQVLRRWHVMGTETELQKPPRPLWICLVVAMRESSQLPPFWSHLVTLQPKGGRHWCRCKGEVHLVWQEKLSKAPGARWPSLFRLLLGSLLYPSCSRIFLAFLVWFLPYKLWVSRCAWAVFTCKSKAGGRWDQGWEEATGRLKLGLWPEALVHTLEDWISATWTNFRGQDTWQE